MSETISISKQGARKAALLLLSLNKDDAAKVLSYLDDKMIEEVISEMSQIRVVSKNDKEVILKEFKQTLTQVSQISTGGLDTAKEILSKSVGQSKAEEMIRKIGSKDISNDFDFLNDIESNVLGNMLLTEAPQTIAVTLAFIHPKKAAEVLKILPNDLQSKVAMKLAITSKTHPEAISQIAKILKKKYENRDKSELSEAGGTKSLADILNHMDKKTEETILKELNNKSPDIAEQVKDQLYSFEDILNLDSKEMRVLINRMGGNELVIIALRGAGDEIKSHFFASMSQNRASDIIEEMETRGKITLREINLARAEIVNIARDLEEEGIIILKKKKEEFI